METISVEFWAIRKIPTPGNQVKRRYFTQRFGLTLGENVKIMYLKIITMTTVK